jgi:hypothetical protein
VVPAGPGPGIRRHLADIQGRAAADRGGAQRRDRADRAEGRGHRPLVGQHRHDPDRRLVTFSLLYKGAATNTGDLKFSFSAPSGSTFAGGFLGITNPLALYILPVTVSSTLVSYGNGTSNPLWCQVTATLVTSSVAGAFTLTWAQNTSSATATTLMAGSSLRAAQV